MVAHDLGRIGRGGRYRRCIHSGDDDSSEGSHGTHHEPVLVVCDDRHGEKLARDMPYFLEAALGGEADQSIFARIWYGAARALVGADHLAVSIEGGPQHSNGRTESGIYGAITPDEGRIAGGVSACRGELSADKEAAIVQGCHPLQDDRLRAGRGERDPEGGIDVAIQVDTAQLDRVQERNCIPPDLGGKKDTAVGKLGQRRAHRVSERCELGLEVHFDQPAGGVEARPALGRDTGRGGEGAGHQGAAVRQREGPDVPCGSR